MALTRETATTLRTVIQTMIEDDRVPMMSAGIAGIVAFNVILILSKFDQRYVLSYDGDGDGYYLNLEVEGGGRFGVPVGNAWVPVLDRAYLTYREIKQEKFREAVAAKKMRDALGAV